MSIGQADLHLPTEMSDTNRIELDLPASLRYLNLLGACISAVLERIEGIAEPQIVGYNIQLAADEIFTNIVQHAYKDAPGGRIRMALTLAPAPRQLVIELCDTGAPFDPTAVPQPDLDAVQEHGYGLFLVHQLMDEVTYHSHPHGNRWRLAKYL